jgi:hypothetical protein
MPCFVGWEIVDVTARLSVMNLRRQLRGRGY